jgi:hypothetical protein
VDSDNSRLLKFDAASLAAALSTKSS